MSGPPPGAPRGIAERVILNVKGGVEDWKEQLKVLLLTLKKQPGFVRARWGPFNEDPSKLDLVLGWQTAEASQKFFGTDDFNAAMAQFKPVMASPPEHYFIHFRPFAPREGLDSPWAEIITITTNGDEDELRAKVAKAADLDGTNAYACGYSPDKPNTFIALVAWKSLEQSNAADKSVYIPDVGPVERHHVNFHFPIKGFSVTNTN